MKIVVCDDDREICNMLAEAARKLCPHDGVSCCCCGEELLAQKLLPDILFLDIQMPGINGMKTAARLREKNKAMIIIFITAAEKYVFNAFDVGAFHYLVKPFSMEKFTQVLQSAVEEYKSRTASDRNGRQLVVKTGGIHVKINTVDIVYAEVFNRKVIIHKTHENIEYYGRIKDLEAQAGDGFFRCHRSYLVNMDYVVKYDGSFIYLEEGAVPIAKQNYSGFVKAYMQYIMDKKGEL